MVYFVLGSFYTIPYQNFFTSPAFVTHTLSITHLIVSCKGQWGNYEYNPNNPSFNNYSNHHFRLKTQNDCCQTEKDQNFNSAIYISLLISEKDMLTILTSDWITRLRCLQTFATNLWTKWEKSSKKWSKALNDLSQCVLRHPFRLLIAKLPCHNNSHPQIFQPMQQILQKILPMDVLPFYSTSIAQRRKTKRLLV